LPTCHRLQGELCHCLNIYLIINNQNMSCHDLAVKRYVFK
jgi:hypothetical protein